MSVRPCIVISSASLRANQLKLSHIVNASFARMTQKHSMPLLIHRSNATANLVALRTYATTGKDVVKSDGKQKTDEGVEVVEANKDDAKPAEQHTLAQKLKIMIKDYGGTVLVFHVSLSLLSLGFFYQLVSRWVASSQAAYFFTNRS